jgi:hypothetical protein
MMMVKKPRKLVMRSSYEPNRLALSYLAAAYEQLMPLKPAIPLTNDSHELAERKGECPS